MAMIDGLRITPSPNWVGAMGWRPGPGLNPRKEGM